MRRIPFCAGHRLLGHEGKCAHFHGHSYVAEFHLTAVETDDVGRVIDFAEIKRLFKTWIDENWDHGFLLAESDEQGIAAIRSVEPSKLFVMTTNPTAENMAAQLLHEVAPALLSGFAVTCWRVAIWESDETCAEARLG